LPVPIAWRGLQYRRPDRVLGIYGRPAQDCSACISCARKLFSCCCGILEIRFDQLTSSAKTICRRRVRQGLSGVQWNEDDRGAFASFSVGSKCRFDLADRESSELDRSHVGTSYSPTALLAVIFGLGSAFVRRRPRPRWATHRRLVWLCSGRRGRALHANSEGRLIQSTRE